MFVSNTSTLILLAKCDLLGKFIENFGKIEITEEVKKEFSAKQSFDAQFISLLIEEQKIVVKKMETEKAVRV